jgi:hypothetical protein
VEQVWEASPASEEVDGAVLAAAEELAMEVVKADLHALFGFQQVVGGAHVEYLLRGLQEKQHRPNAVSQRIIF